MPTLKKSQYELWNSKLSNDYKIDIQRYVVWNEKAPTKWLALSDGRKLKVALSYREERKEIWGELLGQQPQVSFSVWTDTDNGMMVSYGLGKHVDVGEVQKNKNFNALAKLTGEISMDFILKEAEGLLNGAKIA